MDSGDVSDPSNQSHPIKKQMSLASYSKYAEHLDDSNQLSFDIFKLCSDVGRHNVLPLMVTHAINEFELQGLTNE